MSERRAQRLASAWLRTARAAGASGDLPGAGSRLLAAYAEPHRHYHGLGHLDAVLRAVDDLAGHAEDLPAVQLAAWFHDAVYDPAAHDKEERSATLAEQALADLDVRAATVERVARLVRLTATHDAPPGDSDAAVLCDADLAVLAGTPQQYARYAAGVRAEYAAVPDDRFAAGRTAVLRALLERPALFATASRQRRWEAPARANVAAELLRLAAYADAARPDGA